MTPSVSNRRKDGMPAGARTRFAPLAARAVLASALATLAVGARAFDVRVEGIDGPEMENVQALLSGLRNRNTGERRQAYRAQVDAGIRNALEALGYYRYEIRYRWERPQKKAAGDEPQPKAEPEKSEEAGKKTEKRPSPTLVATLTLGKPVLLTQSEFLVAPNSEGDPPQFRRLKRGLPKEGTQLNHGAYTDFKGRIESTAMRYGYFDGEFTTKELQVDAEKNEGRWVLHYNPGERYRFGESSFQGSQIREPILRNLLPFAEGEPYTSDDIAELNRRLSATGWFNSIVVTPDIHKAKSSESLEVPVRTRVSPKIRNVVETGLGYSTDVGARGRLTWTRPWINDSGHSIRAAADVSKLEQMLDFTYKLPLEENALEHFWLISAGYKHEDLNDTKADTATAALTRRWEPYEGWQKGLSLKWRTDDFTQSSVENRTMMLYPEFSLSRTRSRGGLMPRWGDSQRYTVGYANQMWGSDIDALMLEAQFVLIRTYARKHRFVLRSRMGWIETSDFDRVPPDLRYFAGGDRSIRGYDYESISPENSQGELTGAQKMITGSIEYQLRVKGKWWGAVFLDVGRADNDFEFSNLKKGAGVGVRWESPLGPIKLDIAKPVGDSGENGIQFYIGLGPEL